MTREEAIQIRSRQLRGEPVDTETFNQAFAIIRSMAKDPKPKKQKREKAPAPPKPPKNPWGLTRREVDVIKLMAEGECQKGAAARLGVSRVVVGMHLGRARRRTGIRTTVALVLAWDRYVREAGIQ